VFRELLRQKLAGIAELTQEQLLALEAHYDLLTRWNRVLNLTSVATAAEAVERHYCESVFLAAHMPPGQLRIADVGAGAGFPGFPVAIVRADCNVALIESHHRKGVFLREASRGIANIRVFDTRAEAIHERFDRMISRAVSYNDLVPIIKNIASAADLLTGREAPPEGLGFAWADPVRLPWGRNRFLRSGVFVSRGTVENGFAREN
jgi:16S rRNA (guanine(527)-N(7))-methyltransferase RsmG